MSSATRSISRFFHLIDHLMVMFGSWVLGIVDNVGRFVWFLLSVFRAFPHLPRNFHVTMEQLYIIGITSLPLVATTSVFTGAVTAWQAAYLFSDFIPLTYLGTAVGKTVILEMGPVLTALVVAGRTGAAMTAELGTMAVTEQLDAMKVLDLDPYRFLLAPRVVAAVFMLPILIILSAFVALMGALLVASVFKEMSPHVFWTGVRLFYNDWDVFVAMVKAVVFGLIISAYGCYAGFHATRGAEGVGKATKQAVVASAVTILISNFLVGYALLK